MKIQIQNNNLTAVNDNNNKETNTKSIDNNNIIDLQISLRLNIYFY